MLHIVLPNVCSNMRVVYLLPSIVAVQLRYCYRSWQIDRFSCCCCCWYFFRLNFPVSQFRRASRVSELIFIVDAHCTMYSRFRYMYIIPNWRQNHRSDTILCCFFFVHNFCSFYRWIFFSLDFLLHDHIGFHAMHFQSSFGQASKQSLQCALQLSHFCNILKFNWLLFCIGFKLRSQQLFKPIFLAFIVVHPLCMR